MLLNINQDMVGARQSWGGRVQYASRLPWSLPHALDDVMESVLAMVRDGNTSLLTTRGTKLPVPFTREITAVKGSREPFHARMVPYFDSTDHHAFTPARIGVPATSPHQLARRVHPLHRRRPREHRRHPAPAQRGGGGGGGLYFASAGEDEAAAAGRLRGRPARARVASDVATAVAHVAEAGPADRDRAYRRGPQPGPPVPPEGDAAPWRRSGAWRPRGRAAELVRQALAQIEDDLGADLHAVEKAYVAITGKNPPNLELHQGRAGHGGPGLRPRRRRGEDPGRPRQDARGGERPPRHDAVRGLQLRRRQAERLRGLRGGGGRGPVGGSVVLR